MQRYSTWKKIVLDADGSMVCSCRDAATARRIRNMLNSAEDGRRRGPGSVMIRPRRMKGVKVEWPDTPMLFVPREKLIAQRRQFDRRLAPLKRPGAAKGLRAAIQAPARLRGRVKKTSPRKRWRRENRAAFADYNERIAKHGLCSEPRPSARLRKQFVAEAAAAEQETRKTGRVYSAVEVIGHLRAKAQGRRGRRPRAKRRHLT